MGKFHDSVLSDPSSGHDNQVTGFGLLYMGRLPPDGPGHDSPRAAVDQGLAQEPLVENKAAVDRGDAAFVAAVLHALPLWLVRRLLAGWGADETVAICRAVVGFSVDPVGDRLGRHGPP